MHYIIPISFDINTDWKVKLYEKFAFARLLESLDYYFFLMKCDMYVEKDCALIQMENKIERNPPLHTATNGA